MDREETMRTRYGEMLDMIACMAIQNGGAEQKDGENGKRDVLDVLEMR